MRAARTDGYVAAQFHVLPAGEYSIEVTPERSTPRVWMFWQRLGFNRLSFGVQDFDPAVQKPSTVFNQLSRSFRWWRRPRAL
jgi:hypothetical protein